MCKASVSHQHVQCRHAAQHSSSAATFGHFTALLPGTKAKSRPGKAINPHPVMWLTRSLHMRGVASAPIGTVHTASASSPASPLLLAAFSNLSSRKIPLTKSRVQSQMQRGSVCYDLYSSQLQHHTAQLHAIAPLPTSHACTLCAHVIRPDPWRYACRPLTRPRRP